ncbi:hypothetical protein GBA52_005825 [Prunus armeniaca]|nr:hypothetical protein GBA52_005825 [Prunus armeniaca]
MSSLSRELVFLILQFLDEEKFKETVHKLEQESGFFFNMKHFEDQVQAGEWDEVERYLCGFTKVLPVFLCCFFINMEVCLQLALIYSFYLYQIIRQNEQLSKYGDTKSARNIMLIELKKLIEANPLFRDKLAFPAFKSSRLRTLINQSPLVGPIPKAGAFPPIGAHGPFQPVVSPSPGAIAGWMSSTNPSLPHPAVAAAPPGLVQPSSAAAFLKHPRTPTGVTGMDYQSADSEHLMKRIRTGQADEVSFSGVMHNSNVYSQDDLPKAVVRTLSQGSNVMSMDFHPQQQTILLVGTNVGDISLWEVGSRERLVHKPFKVWDMQNASTPLQIDAHVGGVNDIAFAHPNKQLCIVTCGDDKVIKFIFSTAIDGKIKAWLYDCLGSRVDYDAPGLWCTMMSYSADGTRLFSCGTSKEGESHLVEWNESEGAIKRTYSGFRKRSLDVVQFDTTRNRFLAAGDEFQIKFWDMDSTNVLTAVDADGGLPASPRLRFNKEGSLLAVTTNDSGIKILANNDGLRLVRMLEGRAMEKNRGTSEPINSKPLIVNALGPIVNVPNAVPPALERPDRIQPAVSISNLGTMENSRLVDVKPRISEDIDKIKSWKISDIVDPSQMKALRLPDSTTAGKIVRLMYTNNGLALLALASNAVHKLWKWQRNERNPSGKATAYVTPQLWQPPNGTLMTNDLCVWSIDGWEKKKTRFIQAPAGRQSPLVGETKVQFHNDHTHLLVAHESQIAVYDCKLDCLRSWSPKDALAAPISSAIYSCDGLLVYATFCDGAVGVFDADTLRLRCRVAPTAYIPSFSLSGNPTYPLVVAAHPSEPNQIAVGMTDGSVHVVEPSDVELKWGGAPSQDNGPSNSSNPSPSGQASELPSR